MVYMLAADGNTKNAIEVLRNTSLAAGLPPLYVVFMGVQIGQVKDLGGDALSEYTYVVSNDGGVPFEKNAEGEVGVSFFERFGLVCFGF